ncbi:uncharacterized protein FFB20_11785 [Fusarium fujikuroi]|uniref:CHK kinase-like domain-containing protein n=1 Tax=Gibberella fujikuroi (strain CBS 195.34 / IMI 58289 / NRRL A-6831) TaxID=1279085 RepID=S0E370_GIBF5|nr:uncharacterized protein FFUJ_08037 [Fusarium fujikuroi IMI 58289]KLP04692.1 uncharacterized protein Y057_11828 [Fusarium fujikuroi]QGI82390.1 hypothetical protein CEK25_009119 [Fusarium fujikuroi]CCT69100.1 uncharacterized protein FFUJ_08037 [Fusarium fujikuroi IMI 58289]SCN80621.1 uncharacterized protein FFC1_03622 [Fusarium fujikuroi]SCO02913.1 uncharacterized protein FFB20_11785 [Fusarium fujikuroi]
MIFNSVVTGSQAPRCNFNSERPLPLTPDEVTSEWLSEALGVAVKDFKISSVIHGTSSKVFVDLVFGDGVKTEIPSRVVLKGGFNPVIRETVPQMLPTYRREAEFYYHVAPQTTMLLPKIWFAGTDTVNGQGIFIMSDVSSEATFGTPLEPWAPERVGEALKQLASLHEKTWNTKEEEYPWLFGKDGSKLENPVRNIILALLAPAPWGARFDEKVRPPVAKELLDPDRIREAFQALWKHADADKKYYSLIHGDDHVGNTLIANDGTPGFIDWQGLQYGPSVLDLAYFLTGALTVEDRRKHEASLVDTYLEALHKEGGPKLTREDLWDDYRRYSLQGFLWAMTPQTMQPDEVVFAMAERYSACIIDHGTLELLGV